MSKENSSYQQEATSEQRPKVTVRPNSTKDAAERAHRAANDIFVTLNKGLGEEEAMEPGILNRKGPHRTVGGLLDFVDKAIAEAEKNRPSSPFLAGES